MLPENNILIIDDEKEICLLLSAIIKKEKMNPLTVHNITDAKEVMQIENASLAFLDINLPDGNGLDLLRFFVRDYPEMKVVIISAYDSFKGHGLTKRCFPVFIQTL
jgi:DNA-binding NtrC family response regulator